MTPAQTLNTEKVSVDTIMTLYRPDPEHPLRTWNDEFSDRRKDGFLLYSAAVQLREGLDLVVLGEGFVHSGVDAVIAAYVKGVRNVDCVYAGRPE